MMFPRHITRGPHASVALVLMAMCGLCTADAPPLPSEENLRTAYRTLRAWTDAFELPRPNHAASQVHIDGANGVCVIVRRSGRMLGMGTDGTGDDLMLRRATADALGEALSDAAVSSLPENIRNSIGPSLTLEFEVAGKLTPLVGRDLAQLASRVEPGLDGLALRRRQTLLTLFPSEMRATNTADDPPARLISLAVQSGLDASDIDRLPLLADVTVYSFRTTHLLQLAPGSEPIQTFRGDLVVAQESVNAQSLVDLADGLAAHLRTSMFPEPVSPPTTDPDTPPPARKAIGLMGGYRPFSDQYQPLFAPPLEQALGAFALLRYANCDSIARAGIDAASACAARILRDLSDVTEAEAQPMEDRTAAAAVIFAIAEQPSLCADPAIARLFDDALAATTMAFEAASGFAVSADGGQISPHGQALIAAAMCRLLAMKEHLPANAAKIDSSTGRAALDRAWQSVPVHQRIALLPWIGWAEADFTRATGNALAHADDLRLMRDTLDRSRIGADSGAPPDLLGGLSLTTTGAMVDGRTADAQTTRPAAWLASIIRDERFTPPPKLSAALQNHRQTMRFILQLTARDAVLATCRNPERARGGVRAALWDQTQPVPAQALALITAVQAIQALTKPPAPDN